MIFLLILLAVAVALSAETVRLMLHDGRGSQRLPVSHFEDTRFVGPLAR